MKTLFIACLLTLAVISCKKDNNNTPSDAQTATGTLRFYSTSTDKDKVRFETDGPESFLIYDARSYDYSQYQEYKASFDFHATLIYEDTGETGCTLGLQASPCTYPLRVVKMIRLVVDH
jgi:hypothetical protein